MICGASRVVDPPLRVVRCRTETRLSISRSKPRVSLSSAIKLSSGANSASFHPWNLGGFCGGGTSSHVSLGPQISDSASVWSSSGPLVDVLGLLFADDDEDEDEDDDDDDVVAVVDDDDGACCWIKRSSITIWFWINNRSAALKPGFASCSCRPARLFSRPITTADLVGAAGFIICGGHGTCKCRNRILLNKHKAYKLAMFKDLLVVFFTNKLPYTPYYPMP